MDTERVIEALSIAHGVALWAADHDADPEAIVAIEAFIRETLHAVKEAAK